MPRAHRGPAVLLALALASCGGDSGTGPTDLAARPVLVSPSMGATVDSDTPLFTVTNAQGYDEGQAQYTFRVRVASTDREVASVTVEAGRGRTSARFPRPLLRGALLEWSVTGSKAGSEVSSTESTFRLPAISCPTPRDLFAKRVVDWWLSACTVANNDYNNVQLVLGRPDATEPVPGIYTGMVSLGSGGYVAVDMEACAADGPGDDIRVYQTVSQEPVTVYASSGAEGPWVLVEARKPCGNRVAGVFSRACTFDLGRAGLEAARYVKVEDGELYPCPGGSRSDGADIDAVEILNAR